MAGEKHILLMAEDDRQIAEMLQTILSRNFDVRTYAKGEDALVALKDIGRPVVMLTDNGLEGAMTGFELIREARAIHPAMPIVMLSGRVSPEGQQQLQQWEVPLFTKPVNFRDLESGLLVAQRKLEVGRTPMQHAARPKDPNDRGPA